MITLDIIRERLTEAINNSGISQSELARKLNITHSSVNQYLSGRAMPALDTFANLCVVLDISPEYLLGIKND